MRRERSERAIPTALRNERLLTAHRATTRTMLFMPYFFHFTTAIRGLSPAEFGVVIGVYYGAAVLAEVPSGVVADRLGRRSALVLGATANLLGCLVFTWAHDLWSFVLGELCFSAGVSLMSGADSALLYDSLAAEDRSGRYVRSEGRMQAAWLLTTALGLPLTDWLLVRDGDPVLAVWATLALAGLGLVCALALREPARARVKSSRDITRGALAQVARRGDVLSIVVYSVGVFVLLRVAITCFFNPVLQEAGVPIQAWGSVLAGINVVGGIAAWQGPRWQEWLGVRTLLVGMPVVLVAMYAALATGTLAGVALLGLQAAILGVHPTVVRTLLNQRVSSAAHRATLLSVESLACRLATGAVSAFAGWSLGALELGTAILVCAFLGCLPFLALPFTLIAREPPHERA
ncbi:MAG: MFS transporter [Myxococcota bacterium]